MVSCMLHSGLVATDALCRHQHETSSKLLVNILNIRGLLLTILRFVLTFKGSILTIRMLLFL